MTGPSTPPCRVSAGLAAGLAPLVQLQVCMHFTPAALGCSRVLVCPFAGHGAHAPHCPVQELSLKLQACPFTMLRPDLPGVLLGALVNLRTLDLDLASFAPPVAQSAEGARQPALDGCCMVCCCM